MNRGFEITTCLAWVLILLTGCNQAQQLHKENWYTSPVWSPDGKQVAYFKRYVEYVQSGPGFSFFIGEETKTTILQQERLFLCVNDAVGKSERILAEIKSLPQPDQNTIPNIYTAIVWQGQSILYGAGTRDIFSSGVRRIDLQTGLDELLDSSFEAVAALGQRTGPRIYNNLELYSGAGGTYGYFGNQTIYIFDHTLRRVTVYLDDPLSQKTPFLPSYSSTGK